MADASKAHKLKLANSRKRFKELQELKKKKFASNKLPEGAENDGQEQTPADSLTSSTHSSINNETNIETTDQPSTQNYFNSSNSNYSDNSMFFDSISPKNENNSYNFQPTSSLANMVSNIVQTPQVDLQEPFDCDYSLFNQNQPSFLKETQQIIRPNQDSLTVDDPDIKQNEIFDYNKTPESNLVVQSRQNLKDYLQGETQQVSDAENIAIKNEIVQNSNKAIEGVQNSNLNSLKSFSNQMAQFQSSFNESNSITDLEKRNIELTSHLEQEKNISQQLNTKVNELELRISQLETENSIKDQNLLDISKLKEELQCHTQTIRLLVAEKTELSTTIGQFEFNLKQKNSECDELQARLKNSRSRAFELEQELNSLKSEKTHKESNGHEQNEIIQNLKRDFDHLRDERDEIKQDLLEVREKLKSTSEENSNLQKMNSELSGKLCLAEVKIQQLTSTDHQAAGAQIEKLVQEKSELEKEMATLNTMLKSITKERDESTTHYQHYTEDLNSQLVKLQEQFQKLQHENENLILQEQNRIKHIGDLERQLQSIQIERIPFTSASLSDSNMKNELEVTKELCLQLQMEKTELEENYTKNLNEKEMLLKELSAKNDSLSQLESMVEQLRGNQPDSVKLLATMESDKVAAARAVQQNKDLKEQLESMQEVFAKMDNDKVELTEKLTFEVSINKDLLDKLQKTELQLQRLTDAIEIKDRELSILRETSADLNKQVLQQEQLTDRLRHYEAHGNSSHALQNDLQEAKQVIIKLTNEVNFLRNPESVNDNDILSLRKQLEEVKFKNQELETKLENHADLDNNFNNTSERNKKEQEFERDEQILEREEAMKHLEEKVKRTMQDIADLTDEKQRLEHLVLQLQGETETIGEYVALYQHQRMILKQKAFEKDEQLKQLATDREQIKAKLEKLNLLVEKLMHDKQISPELLNQYRNLKQEQQIVQEHDSKPVEMIANKNAETVEEILALLSEIKTSNLVEPKESVHHCPYCSGQLITV